MLRTAEKKYYPLIRTLFYGNHRRGLMGSCRGYLGCYIYQEEMILLVAELRHLSISCPHSSNKNLGNLRGWTSGIPNRLTVVSIRTASGTWFAQLEDRFLCPPLKQHDQLGFRPALVFHRLYPPSFLYYELIAYCCSQQTSISLIISYFLLHAIFCPSFWKSLCLGLGPLSKILK